MYTAVGLYIHYPYCDIKCSYCDFYSLALDTKRATIDLLDFDKKYLDVLIKELEYKLYFLQANQKIRTIFLGGGTPSKASIFFISELLGRIYRHFKKYLASHIEVSIESNPESLTEEKVEGYLTAGVNRFNVGIQTRIPKLLDYLGRLYSEEAYKEVLGYLRKYDVPNYGVDLIYGIPGQTTRVFLDDVSWALDEGVKHLSCYALVVEKNTKLATEVMGSLPIKKNISYRRQVAHQEVLLEFLLQHNFQRYEVSNYSLEGYQCLHNLLYWKFRPYIGIGVASHSFLPPYRYFAPRNLSKYLRTPLEQTSEPSITLDELFLGVFRLAQYQSFHYITKTFSTRKYNLFLYKMDEFETKGYLILKEDGFQMLNRGLLFVDSLVLDMVSYLENN